MIRTLVMIAAAGFVVSVATLTGAFFIAGPSAVAHGGWSWGPNGWAGNWRHHVHVWHDDQEDTGPQASRDIAWNGGSTLAVDIPADVRYTQAPGPAKITVTGGKDAIADVEVEDGRIRYSRHHDHDGRLTLVISAPSVTSFILESSGRLNIAGYNQDSLALDVEGDAEVKAAGEVKAVALTISGSGDADLSALRAHAAKVEIEGSGGAKLAPSDEAEIDISGSGDVELLTNPPKLRTRISGSGSIRRDGRDISGQ